MLAFLTISIAVDILIEILIIIFSHPVQLINSSSGLEKGCIMLQAPTLKWAPEDCSAVKDFICEQTRCYYYNYGSIPVSSAQG